MDIKISPDQMHDIVSKAIFDSVTPEERERILKAAIVELLTPAKSYGSREPETPLEVAMKSAAHGVAMKIAQDRLAADETFKANIESLFQDVARKLFADEVREKLVEKIVDAVIAGLKPRDY
jgi:hypothetical protein